MTGQRGLFDDVDVGPVISDAVFSPCKAFRYTLRRVWEPRSPRILFVLLNPSVATDIDNDQTVNNCIEHARRFGFAHIVVCNLFAFRNPKPEVMREQDDPVGPDNDRHIREQHEIADLTVIGWGNHGSYRDRDLAVLKLLDSKSGELCCFDINRPSKKRPLGQPLHPCYLLGKARRKRLLRYPTLEPVEFCNAMD